MAAYAIALGWKKEGVLDKRKLGQTRGCFELYNELVSKAVRKKATN